MPTDGSDDDGKNPEYEVGYKKPPKHSQFKPGQSGNPKGRPKRSATLSGQQEQPLFARIAAEKITVLLKGRKVRMTHEECYYRALFKDAHQGDARAKKQLGQMFKESGKFKPVPQGGGVLVVPDSPATSEEWEAKYGMGQPETAPPLTSQPQPESSPDKDDVEDDWNNTPG